MAISTEKTRSETVNRLLKEGFRVQYSNENITVLCKRRGHSFMDIAEVDSNGKVNTETLEEFLTKVLN